jgi:hypothetical protein
MSTTSEGRKSVPLAGHARLTVRSGPDRGKCFDWGTEMVHLGTGPENELVLTDPSLTELHASIMRRNGRYAIYTPAAEGIEVDGNLIPVARWVWLPETASIQFSKRTSAQFVAPSAETSLEAPPTPAPAETGKAPAPHPAGTGGGTTETARGGPRRRPDMPRPRPVPTGAESVVDLPMPPPARPAGRSERRPQKVARFITDGPGDPLVRLGEDGNLPELTLNEGAVAETGERPAKKQTSSGVLLALLFCSFSMTVLLLFVDVEQHSSVAQQKAAARQQIAEFYGREGVPLQPYQIYLREARQAHSRGDTQTERDRYHKVLALLRAEGKRKFTGLTHDDEQLEHLIAVLLSR